MIKGVGIHLPHPGGKLAGRTVLGSYPYWERRPERVTARRRGDNKLMASYLYLLDREYRVTE
jgi:hypothetical protein